jgi:hypothetical protein
MARNCLFERFGGDLGHPRLVQLLSPICEHLLAKIDSAPAQLQDLTQDPKCRARQIAKTPLLLLKYAGIVFMR